MTCDDYQIAFEKHSAGSPAEISPEEVEAHVATCGACSAYLQVSRKVDDAMSYSQSMSPPAPQLDSIRAQLARRRRTLALNFVIGPTTFLVGIVIFSVAASRPLADAIGAGVLGAVAFAAMMAIFARRHIAELDALKQTPSHSLVAGFRDQLDREIKQLRTLLVVFPLLAALNVEGDIAHGRLPGTVHLVLAGLLLACVPYMLVRRRRLVRERALLDD